MKVVAFLIFAISVIAIYSAPTQISENNLGDIVNVNVNAEANISNEVDVTFLQFVLRFLSLERRNALFENGRPVAPDLPF